MESYFKSPIKIKIKKSTGMAHISLRTSEFKIETFKVQISDIADMFSQFREAMRSEVDEISIEPKEDKESQ
jgi:Asp-tRNA(Asn)/Glu-tRNA(Gln) amidotransferase C subunit